MSATWWTNVEAAFGRIKESGGTVADARKHAEDWIFLAEEYGVPHAQAVEAVADLLVKHFDVTPPPPDPAQVLANEPRNLVRLLTDFPTLNQSTRGGVPTGIVATILGAPHTGKTAMATQIGITAASAGWLVLILFKDEGRFAGCVRLGQQLGMDRDKLENQEEPELDRFLEGLKDRDIRVPDPDSEDWVLEHAISWLESNRGDRPALLIVDSLQSAYSMASGESRSLREEINAKMRLLESFGKRGGLALVTSEMNRSGYRNKDEKENIRGIAAGAESRAIEFVSRLILSLEGDAESVVTGTLEKNSPGGVKRAIPFKFDPLTARFKELSEDDAEALAEEAVTAREKKRDSGVRDRVLVALGPLLEPISFKRLREAMRVNVYRLQDVLGAMVEDGEVVMTIKGQAHMYSLPYKEGSA